MNSKESYRVTVVKDKPVNSIYIKQVVRIIDKLEEGDLLPPPTP